MKRLITFSIFISLILTNALCQTQLTAYERNDFFRLGFRIGMNSSVRTVDSWSSECLNVCGWRNGFTFGVIGDLNVADYFTIQPGLFFESRSNSYTLIETIPCADANANYSTLYTQAGIFNSRVFNMPLQFITFTDITRNVRWDFEAGPYLSFTLGSKLDKNYHTISIIPNSEEKPTITTPIPDQKEYPIFTQSPAVFDWGIKFGTALRFSKNYYLGVHYMAGCLPVWEEEDFNGQRKNYGGRNKSWLFTFGYEIN